MAFLNNILKGSVCKDVGGIKEVYFIAYDDSNYAPTIIDGILHYLTNTLPVTLMKFEVDSGSQDEQLSGVIYSIKQSLNIVTNGVSVDKINTIKTLIQQVRVLVHFKSGETKLYGNTSLLDLQSIDIVNGNTLQDGKNITLEFSGDEYDFAPVVNNSTLDEPLGSLEEGVDYTLLNDN